MAGGTGGRSETGATGGAGGISRGAIGATGTSGTYGGGGGGGAADAPGGTGGSGNAFFGYSPGGGAGTAGTSTQPSGGNGGDGVTGAGGGGGGGGGYSNVEAAFGSTGLTGGAGGMGGASRYAGGGGGGGGGGYGAVVIGTAAGSNAVDITGGAGGAGGLSNYSGSGGSGGVGVQFAASNAATAANSGTIAGGAGGAGGQSFGQGVGAGGAGGAGIVAVSGATISNSGTIKGGTGGAGGYGYYGGGAGGTGGAGISGSNLSISNSGTITGGAGGAGGGFHKGAAGAAGAAGEAIALNDAAGSTSTISNYGTISGSNGQAITFGSGNDTLNLFAGESLSGTVTTGGGNDTLNLASYNGNTTGSVTGISGFTTLIVNSGMWTVFDNESYSGGENIAGGSTLVLGAAGSTSQVNFANSTSAATLSLSSAAQPASGGTFGGKLNGFGGNNVLDLQNFAYSSNDTATYANGKLTVSNGTTSESFTLANPTSTNYGLRSDGTNGTDVVVPCFATDTRICTARGDVAVEHLVVGDVAFTASGAHRPIRWLGHRTIDCRRHPRPHDVMPIEIAAHAFGDNRPARDLRVSPGHAICVDVVGEVLIPAESLVNGATIRQVEVDAVTYWHVELDAHDVLVAENLPAESYLDMGNRGFFHEADVVDLAAGPDADPASRTHADFCRPFHDAGALVEVVKAQLAARAETMGWSLTKALDMHLEVDGRRVEPVVRGATARFHVPAGATEVWLVSPTAQPRETMVTGDSRDLGLCLAALCIDDGLGTPRDVALGDPLLCVGFHAVEESGLRWTAGRSLLPAALWEGCEDGFFLRVTLAAGPVPRWERTRAASPVRLIASA